MKLITEGWNIAIRKGNPGDILTNTDTPFIVIPNGKKYWIADPFLFEKDGTTYIFAEYFDYVSGKGKIAYSKIAEGMPFNWTIIIEEEYHLSFPFIFEKENEIYIIPESYQSNGVYKYRAVDFPNKWEKEEIASGVSCVDTALHNDGGYTAMLKRDGSCIGRTFKFVDNAIVFDENYLNDNQKNSRLGGAFFEYDGKTVRVAQDCSESYGESIGFYDWNNGKESLIQEIKPKDLNLNFDGIHTYNSAGGYEIIDLKTNRFDLIEFVYRILRKL